MVYLIQSGGRGGPLKIGTSENPCARLSQLQTGHAARLRLLATLAGGHDREASLLRRFAEHHTVGEWFKPAREIVEYFAGALIEEFEEVAAIRSTMVVARATAPRATADDARKALLELEHRRAKP